MSTCNNTLTTLKGKDILIKAGNGFVGAVTFTDTGDKVGATAHGLEEGDLIQFSVVNTTTSVVIDQQYFVRNPTVNDFEISLTETGTIVDIDADGDGTAVEVFRALGGLQNGTLAFAVELQDVTNTLSNEFREILDKAGVRALSVSGSGFAVDDWGAKKLRTLFSNNCLWRFQVCLFDDGTTRKYWEGCFKLTSLEQSGEYNAPQNLSLTLESSGEFAYNEV